MGARGWFQRSGSSSLESLLAEGGSVERSDRNVLQGTFCFQLSTVFQLYCYIPFTEVVSGVARGRRGGRLAPDVTILG